VTAFVKSIAGLVITALSCDPEASYSAQVVPVPGAGPSGPVKDELPPGNAVGVDLSAYVVIHL
jgi:hypothetical protein